MENKKYLVNATTYFLAAYADKQGKDSTFPEGYDTYYKRQKAITDAWETIRWGWICGGLITNHESEDLRFIWDWEIPEYGEVLDEARVTRFPIMIGNNEWAEVYLDCYEHEHYYRLAEEIFSEIEKED